MVKYMLKFIIFLALKLDFNIKQLVYEFRTAIDDSKIYERLRTGFEIMILGPPNAGKSSLLNYLGILTVDAFDILIFCS